MVPVEVLERLARPLRIDLRIAHGGPDIFVPHQVPKHQGVQLAGPFRSEGVPELMERHGLAVGLRQPLGVPVEQDAGHRVAETALPAGEEGAALGIAPGAQVTPQQGLRLLAQIPHPFAVPFADHPERAVFGVHISHI